MGREPKQTFSKKFHTDDLHSKDAQNHQPSDRCKSKPQCDISSHLSEWLLSDGQQITNVGEDVEKREPSCTVVLNQCKLVQHSGKHMEVPQNIKNRKLKKKEDSGANHCLRK